jgi:hypothetical protein
MTATEHQRRWCRQAAKKRREQKKRAPLLAEQKRRQDRETALGAKIKALPDRRFGVIYADPPWRFEVWSEESGSPIRVGALWDDRHRGDQGARAGKPAKPWCLSRHRPWPTPPSTPHSPTLC